MPYPCAAFSLSAETLLMDMQVCCPLYLIDKVINYVASYQHRELITPSTSCPPERLSAERSKRLVRLRIEVVGRGSPLHDGKKVRGFKGPTWLSLSLCLRWAGRKMLSMQAGRQPVSCARRQTESGAGGYVGGQERRQACKWACRHAKRRAGRQAGTGVQVYRGSARAVGEPAGGRTSLQAGVQTCRQAGVQDTRGACKQSRGQEVKASSHLEYFCVVQAHKSLRQHRQTGHKIKAGGP